MTKIIKLIILILLISCNGEDKRIVKEEKSIENKGLLDNKFKDTLVTKIEKKKLPVVIKKQKQSEYIVRSFYENHLKIKLPISFNLLDYKMVKFKYPTLNANLAKVYSNEKASINILLERSTRPLNQKMLKSVKEQIINSFGAIPEISLEGVTIKKINNKDFVVVEFTSEAIDTRIYNLMFITDIGGETFTGTFNCTVNYMKEWRPKAKIILNSIIIK